MSDFYQHCFLQGKGREENSRTFTRVCPSTEGHFEKAVQRLLFIMIQCVQWTFQNLLQGWIYFLKCCLVECGFLYLVKCFYTWQVNNVFKPHQNIMYPSQGSAQRVSSQASNKTKINFPAHFCQHSISLGGTWGEKFKKRIARVKHDRQRLVKGSLPDRGKGKTCGILHSS